MKLGSQIRENRRLRTDSIKVFSAEYFELTYLKFDEELTLVFMAPDMKKARIKAKSVIRTHNGTKIVGIRQLNSKRLGPDIKWNRDGSKYSRYQSKRRKKD